MVVKNNLIKKGEKRRKMPVNLKDLKFNYERVIYLLRGSMLTASQLCSEMRKTFNIPMEERAVRSIVYKVKKWTALISVGEGETSVTYGIDASVPYETVLKKYLEGSQRESLANYRKYRMRSGLQKDEKSKVKVPTIKDRIGGLIKSELDKLGIQVSGSIDINISIKIIS